jgi:hypothetical protein
MPFPTEDEVGNLISREVARAGIKLTSGAQRNLISLFLESFSERQSDWSRELGVHYLRQVKSLNVEMRL